MKLALWMLLGSLLSSIGVSTLCRNVGLEVWLGMIGPLAAALASWVVIQRQFRKHPAEVTKQLIKAFAIKMVFFAAYVGVLVKLGGVRPVPFAFSFLSYFVFLHILEAVGLHRLQRSVHSTPSGIR